MLDDSKQRTLRRELTRRLANARRELRDQEQRLARLKYEWGIAKRLRVQARSEEEREKWRVQSDVCMGLVLQQESVIAETRGDIVYHQQRLTELEKQSADTTRQ